MDTEYERQIKQGRDRLEVIASAAFTVNSAVQVIAQTLIQEHAPREVEAGAADIVEAGAHARSTCRTLADLAEQAKEGAKALAAISKEVEKIEYAARRLFADLLARADAEEQRRREVEDRRREAAEKRQQEMPFGQAAEARAPRDVPGIDRAVLTEHGAASFRELGRAIARDSYITGDVPERLLAVVLEELQDGEDFKLTEVELAELRAGIEAGIDEAQKPARDYSLKVFLAMARDRARDDAGRGVRADSAESLASSLELLPELAGQVSLIWAAYEETHAAAQSASTPKKRGGRAKK